ncbi:MAG: 1-acyl-sn-glycerol-3-phosphate acyltransferase [Bacteroidetes bacterium]|nr:1-acyl-sn-glycerol-3-phosphate acyltransferase [Bacteroidota bacterium]HET6243421.1 1-acyl-sn-glycerol-3-phosphate acyltransferase [Bacteroidia bacterium]
MFFQILKIIVRIAVGFYYRRTYVKGMENIPMDRPVLLASNHPNAFMDAIVLTLFFPRRVFSLARSDVFDTAVKRKVMRYFRIMPVYRIQDGADQLYKNTEIFEKCHTLLNQKSGILIFPEGICIQERRLRKLRKGLARIAFGSMEVADFKMDLCIVPVGINYTKPARHGGDLFLNIDAPIEVESYLDQYNTDKIRTINKLTADVEKAMSKLIVVIEDFKDDELVGQLESLLENDPKLFGDNKLNPVEKDFIISRKITHGLSDFKKNSPTGFQELKLKVREFFAILNLQGFKLELLNRAILDKSIISLIVPKLFFAIATLPIFMVGSILNYIPYRFPFLLTKKIVKSNVEFFSSINLTIGTLIFIFYYLLISVLTVVLFNSSFVPLLLIAGPFTGKFALYYRNKLVQIVALYKMKNEHELAGKLIKNKNDIVEKIENLIHSMEKEKVY